MKVCWSLWKKNVLFALFIAAVSSTPSSAMAAEHWESRATGIYRRTGNSAVWTGQEMIVFGGGSQSVWFNDGGIYHFGSNTWRSTSQQGAPAPRWFHGAAWTGTEMLIFGGRASFYDENVHNDGSRYNPVTDTWLPISSSNAPAPRSQFASVWTGTEFIAWGGFGGGSSLRGDGARYNPTTGTWTPMSNFNAPAGRAEPTAVWTGTEMIVFGGIAGTPGNETSFNSGARYNPASDTWTPLPTNGAPRVTGHTAVWTGTDMIVWGGRHLPEHQFENTGARYNLADNSWHPIAPATLLGPRIYQASVWTGREMIVWGGTSWPPQIIFGDGARYHPGSDSWTPMTSINAAHPRMMWRPDLAIWTGAGMLLYGGSDYPSELDSTDFYVPDVVDGPPRILSQSQSQDVNLGATVTLRVTAVGTEPLRYQWRHNGTALPDATGATLTLVDAQPHNAGDYLVTVTNGLGSVTSSIIHLTVISNLPLIRITSFAPQSGPVGTSVTLSGSGFHPIAGNNIVRISGVRATVTAASETSLTVTVPAGATYGPFEVTANGLSAESRLGFVVTFPFRPMSAAAFGTAQTFSPGVYPNPSAIADLDGDGRPDMVVATHFAINLYRNDGSGSVAGLFSPATNFPCGEIPGDIHLRDMDGDGRLDMVVNDFSFNTVNIYRNLSTEGNIQFGPKLSINIPSAPLNSAVADLDGDGRLDIITTSFDNGNIGVMRNTSGPSGISFAPRVDFPTMTGPHDVAVQDLDGDGKPDVVVIHHTSASIATLVLRNISEPGTFNTNSLQLTAQLAGNGTFVAFGDLNGDGKPDVVTSSALGRSVTVFQNLSTAGNLSNSAFGPPVVLPSAGVTKRVAVSDLDGDGRLDIAFATELSDSLGVYRNLGGTNGIDASWFAPRLDLASGWNGDGISISDIDLDGYPDIVFCSIYANQVWIYRGIQPTPPTTIHIADLSPLSGPVGTAVTLTGGGFSSTAGSNIVFISGLRATVTASTTSNITFIVPPGATYGPITVTVNGSSVQSLLSFTTTFPPRTLDASAFDSPITFSPGDGPIATRIADLDGDGRPDLAVAQYYANTVAVYANTGTGGIAGVFSPKVDYATGENPFDLHLEDLNGDGKLEMIVMNYSSNTVSVFRNTSTPGNISFASRQDFPVSGHAHNGAVGDVDGDGRPDIVVAVYAQGKIAVLRNTSSNLGISFAPPVDFLDLPEAHDVGIQDLDGDGKADIVVTRHSPSTPAVTVLRNVSQPGIIDEGSLEFAAELNADGTYVVFADFDGDGRQDIVTCSWYAHSVTLFQNFSTPGSLDSGSFGPPVTLPSAGSTKRIAVADLDGDGRVDLAFPTELGDSLGIYRNVGGTNGIDASWFAPRIDLASGWNGDGISIGDIDLDGLPDIIFCSFYVDEVWIYRGIRLTTPEIVSQPTNVTVALGASALLAVQATGGALHYSWYHDGEPLLNATTATLEIVNAHSSDAGNYFVVVSNSGGAVTSAVVTVTVTVDRTFALGAVADVDEGGLVSIALTLASSGEVGGIDFVIHFDATYLAIPEIIWDDSLNNALKEFSIPQRGELRGVIALPATSIPAGTQTLATVQFRARTVDGTNAHVSLDLQVSDMSDMLGDPIVGGTEVLGTAFDVHETGFLIGDNNANHQLDIGDAALLMRLLAQLDSTRAWDIPANDFNLNDRLDSGDVIKILRAIAGIDAPPAGAAGSHTKSLASELASLSPARLQGAAGQLVTLQVRLDSLNTSIAGASFTLNYPVEALRLRNAQGHRVGTTVPGGTPAVWNVAPAQTNYATQNGQITLALSGSSAWAASNTVLADFTFEVQPGAANRYLWPIRIEALEVTGNGFNNRTLGPITSAFVGRSPVSGTMTKISVARPGDVSFNLSGDPGANYRIDFSEDLIHWTLLREILDHTGTIQITDPGAGSRPQRFYRSVPLP